MHGLSALTLNEVSGAAAPVTPHTHLLGDPCLAHVLSFDMSFVQSSSAAERQICDGGSCEWLLSRRE